MWVPKRRTTMALGGARLLLPGKPNATLATLLNAFEAAPGVLAIITGISTPKTALANWTHGSIIMASTRPLPQRKQEL